MKSFLLLIITIFFASCNSSTTRLKSDSLKGRIEENVYLNDYFGFTLKVDSPWKTLNLTEINQLMNERIDVINETGQTVQPISKAVHILLSLTIDTIQTMPHFLISTLDLNMTSHIKNESDYLKDYTKHLKKMYDNYEFEITNSDIGQEKIGNKIFYTSLITIKTEDFLAYQKRYSTKEGDKLLNLMANYDSDFYEQKCLALVNNIRWE